jgi:acyl-CoA thioesterase-1
MNMLRPFPAMTFTAVAALAAAIAHVPATAETPPPISSRDYVCAAPANLTHLAHPLNRLAGRLRRGEPIKIVAIGSSSTAGAGASSPAASYPSRLQAELRELFPRRNISVINRGVNGEEAREMLARLDAGVIAEKPDLVLWQMGTNAVLRDQPLVPAGSLIHEGVQRIKASGADLVLIDPQFAPKVLAKIEVDDMVELIATTAKRGNVNLFHRFAVMRYWRQTVGIPYGTFLSLDELHMNDWGYGCVAKLLAHSIADAVMRSGMSASASAAVR